MTTQRKTPVWPAYLVALLALFFALGGPAYAASLITGADIKDGSVTSADVKNGSLKGADVKDGSLGTVDLSSAAQADLAGQDGAPGPSGTAGACAGGEQLRWLRVSVTSDGSPVDQSVRIGRCVGTGTQVQGDGILQAGEGCDDGNVVSGDGCDQLGQIEGQAGLLFLPSGDYVS